MEINLISIFCKVFSLKAIPCRNISFIGASTLNYLGIHNSKGSSSNSDAYEETYSLAMHEPMCISNWDMSSGLNVSADLRKPTSVKPCPHPWHEIDCQKG